MRVLQPKLMLSLNPSTFVDVYSTTPFSNNTHISHFQIWHQMQMAIDSSIWNILQTWDNSWTREDHRHFIFQSIDSLLSQPQDLVSYPNSHHISKRNNQKVPRHLQYFGCFHSWSSVEPYISTVDSESHLTDDVANFLPRHLCGEFSKWMYINPMGKRITWWFDYY